MDRAQYEAHVKTIAEKLDGVLDKVMEVIDSAGLTADEKAYLGVAVAVKCRGVNPELGVMLGLQLLTTGPV